jgi:MATE family multidrug resistance protein
MNKKITKDEIMTIQAIKDIASLAVPNVLIFVLTNINEMVSLVFIGQTGNEDFISTVGLGSSVLGLIILQPLLAIGSSLDTLISQEFGKGNLKLCGDYLNKAVVFFIVMFIPLSCILPFVKDILLAVRFEKSLAELLGSYVPRMVLYAFTYGSFYLFNRFLNAQQIVYPQMAITILTSLLHPLLCYIFIFKQNLGCLGINISYTIIGSISFLSILLYLYFSKTPKQALVTPSFDTFKGYIDFLKVSLAAIFNETLAWRGYYLLMLWGGYMSATSTATNQIVSNTDVIFSMIPTGIGSALVTLVGNSFGRNNPKKAKLYAKTCIWINIIIFMIAGVSFVIFRKSIAAFYTPNVEIQALFEKILPLALLSFFMETITILLNQIFVAEGKQDWLGKVNFILYYIIMLSLGFFLISYLQMEIYGLWTITSVSSVLNVVVLSFTLYFQDWTLISKEISSTTKQDTIKPKQD